MRTKRPALEQQDGQRGRSGGRRAASRNRAWLTAKRREVAHADGVAVGLRALATASVPMLPPAPALLSMMMVWPRSLAIRRASWRERLSALPPCRVRADPGDELAGLLFLGPDQNGAASPRQRQQRRGNGVSSISLPEGVAPQGCHVRDVEAYRTVFGTRGCTLRGCRASGASARRQSPTVPTAWLALGRAVGVQPSDSG
jgi:hypothetical protein